MTTRETQEFYAAFRPKKKRYYCETDHKWVELMPKPQTIPLPDEPMF